jgi:hypothetical protein
LLLSEVAMKLHWTAVTSLVGGCAIACSTDVSLGSPADNANMDGGTHGSSEAGTAGDAACADCVGSSDGGSIPDAPFNISPTESGPTSLGPGPTGWLAFDSNQSTPRGIFFMPPNGVQADRISLWTPTAEEIEPAFSPDGTRLAYTSYASGVPQIYIREFATGNATQLTNLPNGAHGAAWSRDGSLIAFIATPAPSDAGPATQYFPAPGTADLYVIAPHGTGLRDVVGALDVGANGPDGGGPYPTYYPLQVTFGANSALVFTRAGAIDTIGIDGTGLREIVGNQEGAETPSVSPDGTRVAFANVNQAGEGVMTTSFTTDSKDPEHDGLSSPLLMATGSGRALNPAWGPTGFIACVQVGVPVGLGSGNATIIVLSGTPGSQSPPLPISPPYYDDRNPAWAPAGFVPPGISANDP